MQVVWGRPGRLARLTGACPPTRQSDSAYRNAKCYIRICYELCLDDTKLQRMDPLNVSFGILPQEPLIRPSFLLRSTAV